MNVPVGLAGLAGLRAVPHRLAPPADPGARFDPLGLALLSGGLLGAVYGLSAGPTSGWADPRTAPPLAGGVALLAGYVLWAPRRTYPIVDIALLRRGRSALALALSVVSSVVAFAAVFLLPLFTRTVQRHSALATGLALLPQGLVTGVGTALGSRLLVRVDVRTLVTGGFVVLAAASAGLLLLQPATPLWVTAAILSGRAVAIGFGITPLLFAMLRPLRDDELPDGNTVFNIAQRLGGSLGVGLLSSLLAARAATVGPVAAFHHLGVVLAGLALTAAAASLVLEPVRQQAEPSQERLTRTGAGIGSSP